jgi:hypothetical protein
MHATLRIATGLLTAAACCAAVRVTPSGDNWIVENDRLRVTLRNAAGTISVLDKAARHTWTQAADPNAPAAPFSAVESIAGGVAFEARSRSGGKPVVFRIRLTLPATGGDLRVEADVVDRAAPFVNTSFLAPFLLDSPTGAIVVADYSNGHLYPVDLKPFPRGRFNIDMPWVGVCDLARGFGYALIAETADDAGFEMVTVDAGGRPRSAPRIVWDASMGTFRYTRRALYHFSARGGYVALAKHYRALAREQGLLVTLAEKLRKNPNLARIFGAPDVWGGASIRFACEAKQAGVDKMLLQANATSADDMRAINELGYLSSRYDVYQDILGIESESQIDSRADWVPANVVLRADGTRMPAWLTWDKKQFMKRCPTFWKRAAQIVIPKDLAKFPYLGRFIDVTTAEGPYECYDPAHPLNRTERVGRANDQLAYVRSLNLVTGGEHGRWWAVPHLDYIEGMMSGGYTSWPAGYLKRPKSKDEEFTNPNGSKLPKWAEYEKYGIGQEFRVPLWELVFHDCVISTWYWGDSSDFLIEAAPEITAKKDAYNILYGTMPMMWANAEGSWTRNRDLFLRTYRNTCKLHEQVAATEMVSHEFLTPDRAVQRTHFSDGTVAVVNFGASTYVAKVGGKTYRLPQNGFAVRGPKIQQSRALVGGRTVTNIRTASYQFTEPN